MIGRNAHEFVLLRTLTLLSVLAFLATSSHSLFAQSGTWSATGTLNFPRIAQTATLVANGQVLVAGVDSSGNLIASAELYNPGHRQVGGHGQPGGRSVRSHSDAARQRRGSVPSVVAMPNSTHRSA